MTLFREAIVDANGQVDVANLGMFWVNLVVLGTITFVCAMSALSWWTRCHGPEHACGFDPMPIGAAVGAIAAGYATALTALGAYLRLQRRDERDKDPTP